MSSLEQLLHNVCLLLGCRTRDIVKASLGFLKVLLFSLDVKVLASHVNVIVSKEERMFIFELSKSEMAMLFIIFLYHLADGRYQQYE